MSEPKYHTTELFSENVLVIEIEIRKMKVFMNKSLYLGLLTLEISEIAMHELWFDYMKPKHE